jgi:hypothetical protein
LLRPQHVTVPSDLIAQLWYPPPEIRATDASVDGTFVCPSIFLPQQETVPSMRSAQVWNPPFAICASIEGTASCTITLNDCVCLTAASYPSPPAWSAATVHVPDAIKATAFPLTVHVPGVSELNVTAFPDPPPVAAGSYVLPTIAGDGGADVYEMV